MWCANDSRPGLPRCSACPAPLPFGARPAAAGAVAPRTHRMLLPPPPHCTALYCAAGEQRCGGHEARRRQPGRHHRHRLRWGGPASFRVIYICPGAAPFVTCCLQRQRGDTGEAHVRRRLPSPLALARCAPFSVLPRPVPCLLPSSHLLSSSLPAAPHDLAAYLSLLKTDGCLVLVGLPPEPLTVPAFALTARESHARAFTPACTALMHSSAIHACPVLGTCSTAQAASLEPPREPPRAPHPAALLSLSLRCRRPPRGGGLRHRQHPGDAGGVAEGREFRVVERRADGQRL